MARKQLYYSPGQIKKGLYTEGKEWMLLDGTEWVGSYHRYFTGETYTQPSYINGISLELTEYIDLSKIDNKVKFDYDALVEATPSDFFFVPYYTPSPAQGEYNAGYFIRYFVKQIKSGLISESSRTDFAKAQKEHYYTTKIRWKLVGPLNDGFEPGIIDTNRRQVLLAERDIEGISNYIIDYSEFAKI